MAVVMWLWRCGCGGVAVVAVAVAVWSFEGDVMTVAC